jgi:hydroxymethylbilane synthase
MNTNTIVVAARNSLLSRCQVEEVKKRFPHIVFHPVYVDTLGDRDKTTSLRTMDKTDFFTREIDQMLLSGECQMAIHSAKDLPDPLPEGLLLAALTEGIDPADVLVLRDHETFPPCGVAATSSERREISVKELFPDARFVDIRGTIEERVAQLQTGKIDGVVIAEAALIRLQWTHLNRIRLPGKTHPLQGKLAIVIRQDDHAMRTLFSLIK